MKPETFNLKLFACRFAIRPNRYIEGREFYPRQPFPGLMSSESEPLVPKAVVTRLSLYLRELEVLLATEQETVSSRQLGKLLGCTDAQVRKDFAYFGQFGYPGIGYRTAELVQALRHILGTDQHWPTVMVGAGNLGSALLGYRGFQKRGFQIVALLDNAESKIGTEIEGLTVQPMERLPEIVQQHQVSLGMIVVPAAVAQAVADQLIATGIHGILNFAPASLHLPLNVSVVSVDLAIELEQLAFAVMSRHRAPRPNEEE